MYDRVEEFQARIALFGGPRLFVANEEVRLSPYQRHVLALVSADSASGISRLRAAEILWDEPVGAKQRHRLSQLIYAINRKAGIEVITGDAEWLELGGGVEGGSRATGVTGGDFLGRCTPPPSRSFEEWASYRKKDAQRVQRIGAAAVLRDARETGDLTGVAAALASLESGQSQEGTTWTLPEGSAELTLEGASRDIVGREMEVRRLAADVVTRTTGCSFSIVHGPAGIGKTTVLRELHSRLGRSVEAEYISCFRAEQNTMLGPLLRLLGERDFKEVMGRLDSPWREVVSSLLPGGEAQEVATVIPYLDPEQVPIRLYEALRRLLQALSGGRPLLLIVDNFEWADTTLQAMLAYVGTHWTGGRLHVALASRTQEGPVEALKDALSLEGVPCREFSVRELTRDQAEELVRGICAEIQGEVLTYLLDSAGGNPFLLGELASEVARGVDIRGPGALPPSVRDIVVRRLERLGAEEHHLLLLIAVLGRPATITTLATLGRMDLVTTSEHAVRLTDLRLVVEAGGTVDIRHDLTRRALCEEMSETRRAMIHRSIAEMLEGEIDSQPGEIAHHYQKARVPGQVVVHAEAAALRAKASGGVGEAIRFLKMARDSGPSPEVDRRLLGELSGLMYLYEDPVESIPVLELAASRMEAAGDTATGLRARIHRADLLRVVGRWRVKDLADELSDVAAVAEALGEWDELARCIATQVRLWQQAGDIEAAQEPLEMAERVVRSAPSNWAVCTAYCSLAHKILLGDPHRGLEAARRAVDMAEAHDLDDLLPKANSVLVSAFVVLGLLESQEGVEAVARARAALKRNGDVRRLVLLNANQAVWYLDTGRYDLARECLRRAEEQIRGPAKYEASGLLSMNYAELCLLEGNYEEALAHFHRVAESAPSPEAGHLRYQWIREAGPGLAHLRLGNLHQAQAHRSRLPAFPPRWNADPSIPTLFVAELMLHEGRETEALAFMEEVIGEVRPYFPIHALRIRVFQVRLAQSNREVGARLAAQELRQSHPSGTDNLLAELRSAVASYH